MRTLLTRFAPRRTLVHFPLVLLAALTTFACTKSHAQTPDLHDLVRKVTFSSDGRQAIVFQHGLKLVDTATGKVQQLFAGNQFEIFATAFSADGKRILSGDGGELRVWNAVTGKLLIRLDGRNGNLSSLGLSPDGRYAVSGHSDGSGVQFNPARDLFLWDLEIQNVVAHHDLQPDRLIAQAFFSWPYEQLPNQLRMKLPRRLTDHLTGPISKKAIRFEGQKHVNTVRFATDGRRVICGRADGTARVLDVNSGTEEQVLKGHDGDVREVAFSPDGQRALTAGADGAVRVWQIPENLSFIRRAKEEYCLNGHKGAVFSAAFSPDGRRVVSGGADSTVRVWDLGTGKEMACYQAKGEITSVAFVGDQSTIAGASHDESIHIWKLSK
jgi:WD40 repeat protein